MCSFSLFPLPLAVTTNNGTARPNMTSISTSTQSNFPTASVPTTGELAGTAQVPFPAGLGGGQGNALGPPDSYVAGAWSLLPPLLAGDWPMVFVTAFVGVVIAGAALL